jgi:hypothetical protein
VAGYNINGPNPDWLNPPIIGITYEEGFIYFNNEDSKTFNLTSSFTSAPYVIYETVPNGFNTHNVNVFGTALPTTTQLFIGTSAPYSGAIHYIALDAQYWPQPYTSGSSTHVYAGEIDLTNQDSYTANYNLPAGGSNYIYYDTVHENFNSYTADVNTENNTKSNTTSVNNLSAQTTNKLHFIIFRLT